MFCFYFLPKVLMIPQENKNYIRSKNDRSKIRSKNIYLYMTYILDIYVISAVFNRWYAYHRWYARCR